MIGTHFLEQKYKDSAIEQIFLGKLLNSRFIKSFDREEFGELFDPISHESLGNPNKVDPDIIISVDLDIDGDKMIDFRASGMKFILNLKKLLRFKDFFQVLDPLKDSHKKKININNYQNSMRVKFILNDFEINLPAFQQIGLIAKGSIEADAVWQSIELCKSLGGEACPSKDFKIDLKNFEVFVPHENEKKRLIQQRNILQPLSVSSLTSDVMTYMAGTDSFISELETKVICDKVIVRVAAKDIVTIADSIKKMGKDLEEYEDLPKFIKITKLSIEWKDPLKIALVEIKRHLLTVKHQGI